MWYQNDPYLLMIASMRSGKLFLLKDEYEAERSGLTQEDHSISPVAAIFQVVNKLVPDHSKQLADDREHV